MDCCTQDCNQGRSCHARAIVPVRARVPALKPREYLPSVADHPRAAFSNGWFSGIAVGFVSGLSVAVILLKA